MKKIASGFLGAIFVSSGLILLFVQAHQKFFIIDGLGDFIF